MSTNELEQRQSEVIEAMRFPLIILVVFIHILPDCLVPIQMNLTGMNIYHLFSETISHIIGRIAVPCFFLFSGFFFFRKLEDWSLCIYRTQLIKRSMTLLIPYLLWNILMVMAICTKQYIFSLFSLENQEAGIFNLDNQSWFELLWQGPVNFPLWYLRDLICMSLLAPVFYYLFKYLKIYGILILLAMYLTGRETTVTGLSITALLFFGIGSYLGICKRNILALCLKVRYQCGIGAFFFLCCSIDDSGNELWVRPFILFGIVSAINIMNWVVCREPWKKRLCQLSVTVFFIYAIHEIYIINWTKGFFSRTFLVDSGSGLLLIYVLIPVITISICLVLYFLLNKMAPGLLAFMIGGRIRTKIGGCNK